MSSGANFAQHLKAPLKFIVFVNSNDDWCERLYEVVDVNNRMQRRLQHVLHVTAHEELDFAHQERTQMS